MSRDSGRTASRGLQHTGRSNARPNPTRLAWGLLALLPLAACQPQPASAPAAGLAPPAATSPAPSTPAATSAPAILQSLAPGMAQDALQHALAGDGWLPLEDRDACVASLGEAMANACRNLPELESCDTAKATCQVQFAKAGQPQRLELVVSDTQSPGAVQLGNLVSAAAAPIPDLAANATPAACPATDFAGFLKHFAGHPETRAQFSAPLLQVTRVVEDEESDESPRQVLIPQAREAGFLLGYADGKFQLLDSAGQAQGPVEPVIAEQGQDAQVALPDNVEGIAYLFRKHAGCWQLVGHPDRTTP